MLWGQGTAQNPCTSLGGSMAAPGIELLKEGSQGTANCKLQSANCKLQTALLGHIWGTTNCKLPCLGTRGGPRAGAVPLPEPALCSPSLGPAQTCTCTQVSSGGISQAPLEQHFTSVWHQGWSFPSHPSLACQLHSWESGVTQSASQILWKLIPE